MKKLKFIKAHTFVEMTVVIVVLGLVALFLIPTYGKKTNWGTKYGIGKSANGMARSNMLSDSVWFKNKFKGVIYNKTIDVSATAGAEKIRIYQGSTPTDDSFIYYDKDKAKNTLDVSAGQNVTIMFFGTKSKNE